MEKFSTITNQQQQTEHELPPGFRFHPTDEELITHYLSPKILDNKFSTVIIGEIDLNKVEPWELPGKGKIGEKEWYFFCKKDRKYPTGLRTNRASGSGYWKATGRDKEIFRKKTIVGKKKSLVFYKGRAPKGEKSNWVLHEYRLVGKICASNSSIQSSKVNKDDWVLCRIYNKSSGVKKIDISELLMKTNRIDDTIASNLPALMDFSSDNNIINNNNNNNIPKIITATNYFEEEHIKPENNLIIPGVPVYSSSSSSRISDFTQLPSHLPKFSLSPQDLPFSSCMENLQYADMTLLQQQSIRGLLVQQSNGPIPGSKQNANMGLSVDSDMYIPPLTNYGSESWAYEYGNQEFPVIDTGPVGLNCMWSC